MYLMSFRGLQSIRSAKHKMSEEGRKRISDASKKAMGGKTQGCCESSFYAWPVLPATRAFHCPGTGTVQRRETGFGENPLRCFPDDPPGGAVVFLRGRDYPALSAVMRSAW